MASTSRGGAGPNPGPDLDSSNETERDDGEGELSDDRMFWVLSNRRRRQVMEYLRDRDETVTVGELAEHIASEENGTTVQQLTSSDRKRVYVSLYQNHLPVMDEANVVDYAENRKTVTLRDNATKLKPYLDDASEWTETRAPAYMALLVSALVLFGTLQVGPFATVPTAAWTVVGIVGLVGGAYFEQHAMPGE